MASPCLYYFVIKFEILKLQSDDASLVAIQFKVL